MAARIIAIDGPAASGKSSTGKQVAGRLGLLHIDSGSLYRAVTWVAIAGELRAAADIVAAARALPITLDPVGGNLLVRAEGQSIDDRIRDAAVTSNVSTVSAMPEVREWVDALLRAAVEQAGGAVVDGRDIGTVVFPQARLKIFLTATPEARARRRLLQRGATYSPEELAAEAALLAERDRRDSTRAVAPLKPAGDAILLDTTALGLDEQVARIVAIAGDRGLSPG